VPTGRVPKLSFVGAILKVDWLASAVGAAAAVTIASVKMSRFIVSPSRCRLRNIDCYLFAAPRQGAQFGR
jgi:hypothetical protein